MRVSCETVFSRGQTINMIKKSNPNTKYLKLEDVAPLQLKRNILQC